MFPQSDIDIVRATASRDGVVKLCLLPRRLYTLPPDVRRELVRAAGVVDSHTHAKRQRLQAMLDILRDQDMPRRNLPPSVYRRYRAALSPALGPPQRGGYSESKARAYVMRLTGYLSAMKSTGISDPGFYAERLGVTRETVSTWNRRLGLDLDGLRPADVSKAAQSRLLRAIEPEGLAP